jgi:hypothetical protein
VLLAAGMLQGSARAQSLWGRSSTFVRGFVRPTDREVSSYIPFYEMVELHGRKLGIEGLTLDASLWGLIDLVDIEDRYRVSGDVSTLFLSYRAPSEGRLRFLRGLEVTAGRQLVALGPVILEQIDGGKVHYLHSSGLEVGIFGGAPTGTRVAFQPWPLDEDRYSYGYSWLIGGRIGFLDLGHLAAGASFVQRRYRGRVADNDFGLDLSYSPLQLVELSGSGVLSLEALRPREARGAVRLRPLRALDLELAYLFSSPDLWVPRSSIFAVFSEETYQEAGLDLRWQASRALTFDAGYGRRFYRAAEDGRDGVEGKNRASLRAALRFGPELRRRVLLEAERVEAPESAYTRVRLAGNLPFRLLRRAWAAIIELDTLILDELFRGTRASFTGGGYVQTELTPRLSLLAGGNGSFSPLLENAGSFLARLCWEIEVPSSGAVAVRRGGLQ